MSRPAPDPQRAAAALAYHEGDRSPRLVAKGRGLLAERIIEQAHASGVYVHESRELLALLMQIDLDSHIPPQLYIAVAELLAWLYHLEQGGTPPLREPDDLHP
jgi:flagellar biosynthesis protein